MFPATRTCNIQPITSYTSGNKVKKHHPGHGREPDSASAGPFLACLGIPRNWELLPSSPLTMIHELQLGVALSYYVLQLFAESRVWTTVSVR